MSEELKYARYRYKKVDDGDSVVDCDDEWVDICKLLDARVAELEAERTTALDMVRDRIDAAPSTMTEAVDGLLKLYKMEFDERLKLQAQLDRANTSLKDWKQRAARMALKAKPLLDRAPAPRAGAKTAPAYAGRPGPGAREDRAWVCVRTCVCEGKGSAVCPA